MLTHYFLLIGGIIGLGEAEEDRVGLLHTLATLPAHPESVPINALLAVKGTPLEDQKVILVICLFWQQLYVLQINSSVPFHLSIFYDRSFDRIHRMYFSESLFEPFPTETYLLNTLLLIR